MNVEDVWRRQRQWSALAGARTAALRRGRWANLVLVLLGALLGGLAAQSWFPVGAAASTVGLIGAALLVVAASVQANVIGPEKVKERVTARSAAETLRTAVYRFQAVAPAGDAAQLESRSDLVDEMGSALAAQVRASPVDATALPEPGIAAYVRDRVRPQLDFHSTNAVRHAKLDRRWRGVEITATLVAALLSGVGGVREGTDLSAWVGVVTTLAGAVAAHLASEQHARIAARYASTADQLERLLKGFDPGSADPVAAAAFVDAVENVLDRQNSTWAATLVGER